MTTTPDCDAEQLYRSLSTPDLQRLVQAFLLDRRAGADLAFCDQRLAVIRAILTERGDPAPDRGHDATLKSVEIREAEQASAVLGDDYISRAGIWARAARALDDALWAARVRADKAEARVQELEREVARLKGADADGVPDSVTRRPFTSDEIAALDASPEHQVITLTVAEFRDLWNRAKAGNKVT